MVWSIRFNSGEVNNTLWTISDSASDRTTLLGLAAPFECSFSGSSRHSAGRKFVAIDVRDGPSIKRGDYDLKVS